MTRADDMIRLLPAGNTRASLAIDGPASATWNTVVQATKAYEGPDGAGITLAAVADGTWAACVGTLTLAGNAVADETVTIDTTVYTWKAAPTTGAFEVKVGASASASIDNLIAAINLAAGAGTLYGSLTTEHPTVRAYAGAGDTMVVHSRPDVTAAAGTLIATTEGMTQGSWGAATLGDGTDGTNVTFVTTGDDVVCHFANGYSTVEDFEAALAADASASAVMEVKTAGTTPLYLLAVTDDDFSATTFTGSGSSSSAAPSLTDESVYKARPFYADEAVAIVRNTDVVTGTTKTATVSIWGWHEGTNRGYLVKALNGGSAIAETVSEGIAYTEVVTGLGKYSKLYASFTGGGAGTEAAVYLDFVRPGAHG